MYICFCNAIRDSEIRELAMQGVRTAEAIHGHCGCEPNCWSCFEDIQQILDGEWVFAGVTQGP